MELLVLLWGSFGIFCSYYHYLYYDLRSPVCASQIFLSLLVLLYGLLNSSGENVLTAFVPAYVFLSLAVAAGPSMKTTLVAASAFLVLLAFQIGNRPYRILLGTGALIECIASLFNWSIKID